MAKTIAFDELVEGRVYYEEYIHGSALIPCRIEDRQSATNVTMAKGTLCPWRAEVRYTGARFFPYRYWDAEPTEEEREKAAWEATNDGRQG